MKKESLRKYSLLGLVLIAASAVTAAVLPKNEDKKQTGRLQASARGTLNQLTCSKDQATGNVCDWTATQDGTDDGTNDGVGSRTTTAGNTSSITNALGNKVATLTDNILQHTSHN